jgi:hypothetical protein
VVGSVVLALLFVCFLVVCFLAVFFLVGLLGVAGTHEGTGSGRGFFWGALWRSLADLERTGAWRRGEIEAAADARIVEARVGVGRIGSQAGGRGEEDIATRGIYGSNLWYRDLGPERGPSGEPVSE